MKEIITKVWAICIICPICKKKKTETMQQLLRYNTVLLGIFRFHNNTVRLKPYSLNIIGDIKLPSERADQLLINYTQTVVKQVLGVHCRFISTLMCSIVVH